MISDCKVCSNKDSEICRSCAETSGGRPSHFKPIEENTGQQKKNSDKEPKRKA